MPEVAELRAHILAWYRENRRDLPWRRTNDPYAIWVSEVMLQQTRVDTVIPYYERFIERWPSVRELAAADADDIRAAWSGLGYYRRARLMMDAAASIVRDHRGRVPGDFGSLSELPGFGRYTAGAVASIAFGEAVPAVDGNVSRVLARVFGVEGDVSGGSARDEVWRRAGELAPGEAPGDLNQALIELGALVCSPRSPRCGVCPVRSRCSAHGTGRTGEIPAAKKKSRRGSLEVTALLVVDRKERVLLEKQPEGVLFAGLWCLPVLDGHLDRDAVADEAERKYGLTLERIETAAEVKHVLTHRDIWMRIVRADCGARVAKPLERVALDSLDRLGVPSLTVRALRAALPRSTLARAKLPGRATAGRVASTQTSLALPLDPNDGPT